MKSGWVKISLTCKAKKCVILNDNSIFISSSLLMSPLYPILYNSHEKSKRHGSRGPCIISYCFQWMLHDIAFWVKTIQKRKLELSKLKFSCFFCGEGVAMTSREWHHCVTFLMIWGVSGTEQKTNDLITKMMFLCFPFSGLLL